VPDGFISPSLSLEEQIKIFLAKWPGTEFKGEPNIYAVTEQPMAANKKRIMAICDKLAIPKNMQLLMIAKGMIESQGLSVNERDVLKDPGGPNYCGEGCINYGFANLNTAMIRDIMAVAPVPGLNEGNILATNCPKDKGPGPSATCDPAKSILNKDTDEGYEMVIKLAVAGIKTWGLDKYFDYVRGGETLFKDTKDYTKDNEGGFKIKMFKTGLSKIVETMLAKPELMTDNRRVSLQIDYV
jgi:hypothetical protein